MFAILFSFFVVIALLSILGEIAMRVRLTRSDTSRDKLAWWRWGGDEVTAIYEELYPDSRLPIVRPFAFWLFIACSAVLLLVVLQRSN
jgi:hypothetical protein